MTPRDRQVRRLTQQMHRINSEAASQACIELMLTDHTTEEVVTWLRAWATYLDERR
jgi:hypothetical protein